MKVWQYFLSVYTNGYLWIFSYRELYGVANVVTAGLSVRALYWMCITPHIQVQETKLSIS
jgi:hypothetical protein